MSDFETRRVQIQDALRHVRRGHTRCRGAGGKYSRARQWSVCGVLRRGGVLLCSGGALLCSCRRLLRNCRVCVVMAVGCRVVPAGRCVVAVGCRVPPVACCVAPPSGEEQSSGREQQSEGARNVAPVIWSAAASGARRRFRTAGDSYLIQASLHAKALSPLRFASAVQRTRPREWHMR